MSGVGKEHILMIGAGGMGMAPLALLLRGKGHAVSGVDDALGAQVRDILRDGGVRVLDGPDAWPEGLTHVVRSSAVAAEHPLVAEAMRRGVPVERRGECLARLAEGRRLVAVAGSHGKTTTTGYLVALLRDTGVPVSWAIGGLPADGYAPGGWDDSSPWLVAEVDESDGTQNGFSPAVTVLVNLDWDHPDQYPDEASLRTSFARLLERTTEAVVVPEEGELATWARAAVRPGVKVLTVGAGADCDVRILVTASGKVLERGRQSVELPGATFQAHDAALAWLAAEWVAGGSLDPSPLGRFGGLRRRQTRLFSNATLVVYEDYAHHPTELAALFAWARVRHPGWPLVVAFQPHRYTRTARLRAAFARALEPATRLILLDVYPAGEAPMPGGTTRDLEGELSAELAARTRCVTWQEELERELDDALRGPAVLLFVGAGDIDGWARNWVHSHTKTLARGTDWMPTGADIEEALSGVEEGGSWIIQAVAARVRGRREAIEAIAKELDPATRLEKDRPLAPATTLRVGGAARWYAEPAHAEDLLRLQAVAADAEIPVFLLGRGSNLVVPDAGFNGLVIRLAGPAWTGASRAGDGLLRAGGGTRLKSLCGEAARAGWSGLEFLDGIPGTVGGSLRMNAGAMGGWIFERVQEVTVQDVGGEIRRLPRKAFHPVYRDCPELREMTVLEALFDTTEAVGQAAVRARLDAYAQVRRRTQPREPSAGCMFKNPEGDAAGRLIEAAGLKGCRIGEAEVSMRHANFIINRGGAMAEDVLALVRHVRGEVLRLQGIELEPEAILLGRSWEEVWS